MRYGLIAGLIGILTLHSVVSADTGIFAPRPILAENFTHGVDPAIWESIERAGNDAEKPGGEKQYYTPLAIHTDQNGLHIVAEQKSVIDPHSGLHLAYTSGRIESRQSFLYGRFEFRARLPKGDGYFPALWLRTPEKENPINGEIDVIEGFGGHPDGIQSSLNIWDHGTRKGVHCVLLGMEALTKTHCSHISLVPGKKNPDLTNDYHVFAIEWLPDHITWLLDGKPYFTVTQDIPHVPMRIVINLALGAAFSGPVTAQTPFPGALDIKNVNVWPLSSAKENLNSNGQEIK